VRNSARVVVVGGGIAGLAAAHRVRELRPDAVITVLERADRLGGKIRTMPLAGVALETGAETFLVRERGAESAVLDLARRIGLGGQLVHPAPVPAALALSGALRPLPTGTLMGIPANPATVQDIAVTTGRDDDEGRPLLAPGTDVAVGALVRARLGDDVVDRLVDPLLGGVYAGRADELSLEATIPGLHRAATQQSTLAAAVRQAVAEAPRPAGEPVFASVHGGLTRLVNAVADTADADVRFGETVRALARTGRTWRVTTGPTVAPETYEADAVVLAVPGPPAARLLGTVAPDAADAIDLLDYASVVLVTLALPPDTELPPLSGFLVPATEGYAVKAATFFSRKWTHLSDSTGPSGPVFVRASLGRMGEAETLRLTDDALIDLVRDELPRLIGADLMSAELPEPIQARVNRWGGALPQYAVGHVTRVAAVRAALEPTLALAGAAYDGVGIAACVRSGEAAAQTVVAALAQQGE
jgi:oxygen-dependent protoporphyrinogen oxidase